MVRAWTGTGTQLKPNSHYGRVFVCSLITYTKGWGLNIDLIIIIIIIKSMGLKSAAAFSNLKDNLARQ